MFKNWLSKSRTPQVVRIHNVDKDVKMDVDVSKVMGAAFYWTAYHEFNEWRYLNNVLTSNMVFVDIGANQGEYSLFAAKRLTNGKVYAFEPVSSFFNQLCNNKDINHFGNIVTLNYGLSDVETTLPIYMGVEHEAGEHEGLATLFKTHERSRFVENIQLKVFDTVAANLGLQRMDVVKIDVEGAELSVLRGMKNSLQALRPQVILEMNAITFASAGYSAQHVVDFFKEINYSLFKIGKKGNLMEATDYTGVFNGVFVSNN